MRRLDPRLVRRLVIGSSLAIGLGCGGGGDGGGPPAVATVTITAPPVNGFQTLTRTLQLTAVARDAAGAAIAGVTVTWGSSNSPSVGVSGSGLVTAVSNGTANITATAGGVASAPVAFTVQQFAAGASGIPTTVAFGALGSSRTLAPATVADSSGAPVPGAAAFTWVRAGTGASATVTPAGLVTSVAIGIGDTAVGTSGTIVHRVPIAVTQIVASIAVSPTALDTLKVTGRTKQFTAVASDSNANVMGAITFTWTSTAPGVASVNGASGLATAVADGNTNVTATASAVSGFRTLTVRRIAQVLTITPPNAAITTNQGTQGYAGVATDSSGAPLPISWTSRATTIATVSPATGTSTTASATGNGAVYVVIAAGTKSDSSELTVTNQVLAPSAIGVDVASNFFRSQRNLTQNEAIDTLAVNGTVTWTLLGGLHTVTSTGAPIFASSGNPMGGTYMIQFNATGTYTYTCANHGNMTGRLVVR